MWIESRLLAKAKTTHNQLVHPTRKNVGLDPRKVYVPLFASAAQVTSALAERHRTV
jgi:hypothetical protein